MVDTTIRIGLEIDGSQAIKEFENVTTATEGVLANMKKIRSESDSMMPDSDSFYNQSEASVRNSFSRIDAINKQIDNTPIFSEHQLENLYAEREMLRRGIEATVKEMQQFASSSTEFIHSFSSKKGGTSSLQAVTKMMPSLMNIVRQVADFQRESDTLMDTAAFKAGIKNKIAEAGLTTQLGFAKDSKSMDKLADYLMLKGTDQTQRKSFMSKIASGYEKKQHLYDNFSAMLPDKFRDFHAAKGTLAAPDDSTQITTTERRRISELLKTNPYFMQAAEATGVGRRMNGTIEMRSGITRGMINRLAGNLYGTIISSAKGMPMYGITDVDDPQYWDRIARKSNKPFLGSMNSARALSDNFSWLKPSIGGTYKGDPTATYTPLVDEKGKPVAVPFSPNIKRYEVANYTLDDLKKNVDLNKDRTQMYGQTTGRKDTYIPIDHSARLENIFRHRKSGIMPGNNDAVDDLLFLQLDKRFGDPNLDEATRESLMKEYASYIDKGITKTVNGKSTHFSFTRAHKGLGLEFVQDAIFDAMAPVDPNTGERDLSAFWGGVKLPKVSVKDKHLKGGKMVNYTPEEVSNLAAKFVEYASKDATSGESIESLYGTVLPDDLKIGIFDLEDAAKKASANQAIAGAGMNGTSYISKKLVPGGFQARMPGIKTALNSIDFGGFLSHFGGAIKTIGPDGRIEDITPDLDLLLSMSDIKNAGIRYQDENGNLLPTQEIVKNIRQEIKNNGGKIFANKTMDDAQSGIHWMSRQFSQILGDDPEFTQMTTKAFLDEYERVGTLEGALDTVFAGDSEMRDLILSTHGAIMSDRKIQDRIQDFRNGMISRISQGDTILPRELETSRAMAQPWFFNAAISGMKRINAAGTGLAGEGEKTYFDALLEDPSRMTKEQKEILDNITMDNDDVAYQKIMAEILGIGRYPATSRSARQATNVLADGSNRAKMMRNALEKSGFDPNAFYISPSSPLMQLLQDADFDGDVMDLVGLAYSGQEKNGEKLRVADVFQRVYERGMKKIDTLGLSEEETNARKEQFSKAVFKMDSFDARNGMDIMKTIVPAMQGGYFMGGPDATIRNAMQIPWTESVQKAIADAESQYSVNSVRNKQGVEMATTPEQMELLSKYRTFTEFFHAVNKNRDEFGNVDIPSLTEAMRGSDGLSGAKFWATNLPFHTMSPNVRTMMLSRYFAKQRGIDINEGYDWNYIFDSVLGKKDESTALGRMQSGLRDAWMGYLNADYLAMDEESVAKLAELRKLAIDEEAAKVKEERGRQGSSSYGKKGSNRSIAERFVDRMGGTVIKNAAAGMAMTESHLEDEGANSGMFQFLKDTNMPNVVGGIDLSRLLSMKTEPRTFEEMSATTKSTQLARSLDMFNLLTTREKQNRIDNMPRLSFSTLAKLAYHPEEFMKDIVTGRENNSSLAATEVGQAAHTAIEHFMKARMDAAKNGGLNDEQLATAQQEALKVFDQYLGVQKAPAGFKREGRGLTDAERTEMLTPGKNLNERYERLKSFLSGDGLLSVFPEKDWEVIGIESSDVGSGERTAKGNMKIPGKGKKILSPDKDVEMTGSYDLLFKNRKDGRVVMGDIKNYWDPKAEDWEKWKVQQSIYASQLKKNGFDDVSATIIEPYQNRLRNLGLTDYDFMQSDENVAKAVKAIQGLAKNGDTTIKDVYDASRFVRQTLFGEVPSSVGDQVADRYNKYTRSSKRGGGAINPGVITDALWMHDRYNEAIENDEDIHKFINKETRSRDSVYTSDLAWRSKYTQAEAIHESAVQQEKAGRTAEAKDLDARYEAAIRDLDNNMGLALVNHITDFAEDVRTSIDGQSGTKQIQDTVKAFKNTQNQQTGFEKSIELFKDRIKETKGREDALTQSINDLNESDKFIARDEDVYDKLIQYTKEALGQTDDTKGISSRKAGAKRANRTKLLNANAHIRDNSLFAPISQLLANGDDEGALELLEKRKSELGIIRKDTQNERKKKEAEREGERFQGALMNDQLLQAEKKLGETAPIMDIYLNQLKKSATDTLNDSFISLSSVTDKNVRKPFSTTKARTDYMNAVGNSLQDATSLFEAGMIDQSEFERYRLQAQTLMQKDNLSKVEHEAIKDAKRKLGMEKETPEEKSEKWLQDRQQILEAERDLKKREALQANMDAYKKAKEANPKARLKDYRSSYQDELAAIDTKYEEDLADFRSQSKRIKENAEIDTESDRARLLMQGSNIADLYNRAAGIEQMSTPLTDKYQQDIARQEAEKQEELRQQELEQQRTKADEEQRIIDAQNQQRADDLRSRLSSHEVTKENFDSFRNLALGMTSDNETRQALANMTFSQFKKGKTVPYSSADASMLANGYIEEVANNPLVAELGKYFDSKLPSRYDVKEEMLTERRAALETELKNLESRGYTADKGKAVLPGQIPEERIDPITGLSYDERVELKNTEERLPALNEAVANAQALYNKQTIEDAEKGLEAFKNSNERKFEKLTPESREKLGDISKRMASAGTTSMLDILKSEYQNVIDTDENVVKTIKAREENVESSRQKKASLDAAIRERDDTENRISELKEKQSNPVKAANDILKNATSEITSEGKTLEPGKVVEAIKDVEDSEAKAIGGTPSTQDQRIQRQATYNEMMNHTAAIETMDKLQSYGQLTPQEQALYDRLSAVDTRQSTLDSIKSKAIKEGKTEEEANEVVSSHVANAKALRNAEQQAEAQRLQLNQENMLASFAQRDADLEYRSNEAQLQRNRQYERLERQAWGASHSRFINSFQRQEDIRTDLEAQKRAADRGINRIGNEDTGLLTRLKKEQESIAAAKGKDSTEYLAKTQEIKDATQQLEDYRKASEDADKEMGKFGKGSNIMRAGLSGISDTMNVLLKRFGRQMFMKAINEAKQFVKQFDATMIEIQMITLKTDDQMSVLGDNMIEKAKQLKVSITDVGKVYSTLYRQGLSDKEVSERADVITKFSKVSGAKVEDATKLITVAMNTGLVSNAMQAADIVTALGDNAATNAQQIEKGIEKAGAAAAADGTTFAELSAMLTAITSTTQIGGNVAGRTLNTIFGRMNKIGTNELIYDENGNAVSGSAVSKLLKAQGVDTYDKQGNKRSSFDVLYDLSKKWDNISDAGQQQLASAIAGTRQYSNFAAIMQGMSEGKIDEYMGLVAESSGITDEKYEIRLKSLDAALTDIKNTFDSMIKDLADRGVLDGIVDGIEGIITALGSVSSATGGLTGLLVMLSAIAIAMAAIRSPQPLVGALTMAGIMAAAGVTTAIVANNNKQAKQKADTEAKEERKTANIVSAGDAYSNYKTYTDSLLSKRENLIERTRELGKKLDDGTISGEETQELTNNLEELNAVYSSIGSSSASAASGLESWESACSTATTETEKLKTEVQETLELLAQAGKNQVITDFQKGMDEIESGTPLTGENLKGLRQIKSAFYQGGQSNYDLYDDVASVVNQLEQYGIDGSEFAAFFLSPEKVEGYRNQNLTNRQWANTIGTNKILYKKEENASKIDSSSYNGALINLLLLSGLIKNPSGAEGIGKIDYAKQQSALSSFFADTYANESLFYTLFGNNPDVLTWISKQFSNNPGAFSKAMMTGFSDYDLTTAPEEMLMTLYTTYAKLISGSNTELSKIYGADLTEKKKSQVYKSIEELAGFYNLDASDLSANKTKIIGNVKNRIDELVSSGKYGDYRSALVAEYDNIFNEEIEKARVQGSEYQGENVDQTIGNVIDTINLDSKTLGYKNEKASLLRTAKASENAGSFLKTEDMSVKSFIAQGSDTQLIEILQDLKAQENGEGGIYTLNDLIAYLEKQVYGSSESESRSDLFNQAHALSQAKANLAMMTDEIGNEDLYDIIADATKLDKAVVRKNYAAAKEQYRSGIVLDQASFEQAVKNRIAQEYGITGTTEVSEDTIAKINEAYAQLGVSVAAGKTGKGLEYTFSDIGTGKYASNLLDFSSVYTNAEMASVANKILGDKTISSWKDIVGKAGQPGYWTRDELEALANKYPDLKKYYQMIDTQRKSSEGIGMLQALQDQIALESIDTSTIGGAFKYGTTAYQQNNEAGLAANRIFEVLSTGDIENFAELANTINNQTIKDWNALMKAAPDLADKLSELGVTAEDGKINLSGLEEAGKDFGSVLSYILQLVSSKSEQYQDRYVTDQSILESARSWEGGASNLGKSEYQQIVGSVLTSKRASSIELTDFEQQYANTLLSNYENGVIGLTDDQRLTGFETIMQHLNPETGIDKDWLNSIDSSVLDAYTSSYKDLVDAIRNGKPDKASEAWDRLNEQFEKDKTSNITKYNKNASKTAETLTALEKGGKDGAQAIANLRKEQVRLNDTALAINNAKGKKGNQLDKNDIANLSSATGEDSNLIKKMSEQEIEQLRQRAQASIDEDFVSEFVEPIQGRLNQLMTENPVDLEMAINAHIGSDGALDAGEIAAIAAELNDKALTALASQAGTIGTYLIDIIKSGLSITAIGKILQGNVKGSGKRMGGGGGGGGGGKSEADKLIEKQKREMQVLEHQNKLLQTEEKTLEYQNDYEGQNENLNEQINLQYKLRDAYTANIQELQQMMDKTKADTDDWYKLRDAIYAAEEALKEIINTQNELASKSISITERKIENEDKPGTHMSNMLEKYAQRAMSEDRYSDYVKFTNDQIDELTAQKATNDTQLEYWKDEMKKFVEGEQGWIDARDKLWEVEEENAELDNQLVQMRLDLAEQELSQIGKVLQQDTQSAVHNQTIAETYGSSYESGGYRKQYEDMIREQTAATKTIIEENKKAEQSAKEQMDALDENTTAWFEAQAAVFQYQEAVAQAEVTLSELNRALAQSEIDKINEDYEDQTRELLHVNELLSEQAQEYLDLKDTSAYIEAMQMVTTNLGDAIEESAKKVDRLNETYKKGMANGSLDPAMQRELLDQINEAESEYQRFLLDRSKKQREINKAALDDLFEDQDWAASEYDHNIKLLGYQNSIYQNNGELTNVNATIKEENILRSKRVLALQDELTNLERQKALFEDDQEQEKRIVEQIKKHEEAIEQENAQIKKNNKLLEENEKKIMQVRKTLEDAVDKEIEAEKKRQREILSANVSMQDTIVNLLKKRLQDEWDLKKKDIEKEKESLAEYKSLINERYNYRKKASQQADKDEELAEYRRQLALIEADPSRTKDAKELRRKIEDLEKEQAWTIAEDEVAAESERVDDQIKGMDKFVQYNDELLNEILSDANNFATEMNDILSGSFEESYNKIIEFMSKENEAFMKSLPDAQKQMIQSWEDTWKKANDIVDSNYALITETIADKDTFLEFMRSSNRDYRSYLENGDKNSMNLLERQWSEQYDNYVNSIKTGAEFDLHGHELTSVESKIDELKDNIFKVNTVDITGKPIDPYGLGEKSGVTTDFSTGEELNLTDLSDLHYVAPPPAEEKPDVSQTDSGSGNGNHKNKDTSTRKYRMYDDKGIELNYWVEASSPEEAELALDILKATGEVPEWYSVTSSALSDNEVNAKKGKGGKDIYKSTYGDETPTETFNRGATNIANNVKDTVNKVVTPAVKPIVEATNSIFDTIKSLFGFSSGGLVNYTGLAKVHGTPSKPEAFLSSTDTKNIRTMLDAFNTVSVNPGIIPDASMFTDNSTTVGDVNITINQAELKSDDDYAKVAKRVGQEFTKELKRNGLNLSGYSFS